jgi:hypothetical protein
MERGARQRQRKIEKRVRLFSGITAQIRQAMAVATAGRRDGMALIFSKFDSSNDGMVTKKEFLSGCVALGVKMSSEEVDLMWPYFDLDNSGEMNMQEFMDMAVGELDSSNKLPAISPTNRRDPRMLEAMTKSQRRLSMRPLAESPHERRLSYARTSDDHMHDVLAKPLWSLTKVRYKASLLPLPAPPILKQQEEWLLDITKDIPRSPIKTELSPPRNWRESFFEQVKCDSCLRIQPRIAVTPISNRAQARARSWDEYRLERQNIINAQRDRERVRQRKLEEDIEELAEASAVLKGIEEDKLIAATAGW